MEDSKKQAFYKVIPRILPFLRQSNLSRSRTLQDIKKAIRENLPNPHVSIYKKEIAEFLVSYLIETENLSDSSEIDIHIIEYPFIKETLDTVEINTIIEKNIPEEVEFADEFPHLDNDFISMKYLKDDPDWYIQLGLRTNPFPSQDGLSHISKENYDNIVLKTPIYQKYIEHLESNPSWILNKSYILFGDFGCGKTTFFDYFSYHLIKESIVSIRLIMNTTRLVERLHSEFNENLMFELASYIASYSDDPRGKNISSNRLSILGLFQKIITEREQKGFVIFLDGLHKSQSKQNTALEFLIELQNTIDFYRRKGIALSIFVAGSMEWKKKTQGNKKFLGSFFDLEEMDFLNASQAYDMISRRLTFFVGKDALNTNFIKYSEIEMLINSIEKSYASEVNFRSLIKFFLQNALIFKNKIKINSYIEEDVLNSIYNTLKRDPFLFNALNQLKKDFGKNEKVFTKILRCISTTFDMGYFFPEHKFFKKNKEHFKILQDRKIIVKTSKYKKDNQKPFSLDNSIYHTFKDIENKVKFRPTHYFDLLYLKDYRPKKRQASYLGVINTIDRFKENNPEVEKEIGELKTIAETQYVPLIKQIEQNVNFEISIEILDEMNEIIESSLKILYSISSEPFNFSSQTNLFSFFQNSWLNNRVFTQYFTCMEDWNPVLKTNIENINFLQLFIDTFESIVGKFGKHILYNNILIVGSKDLNNLEKIALNSARALFSDKEYRKCVEHCHDVLEKSLRIFIFSLSFILSMVRNGLINSLLKLKKL